MLGSGKDFYLKPGQTRTKTRHSRQKIVGALAQGQPISQGQAHH
jgi:hypothetical protein